MTPVQVRVNVGGRPVLVSRPDASHVGSLSVGLLATFNRARAEGAAVCVLASAASANEALLALIPEDVPLEPASGVMGAWLRVRWWCAAAARRTAQRFARASGSFWLEWHREIRYHAGDERLPSDLRARLREGARRSLSRSAAARRGMAPFPRQWLRRHVRTSLAPAFLAEASEAAAAAGIPRDRPVVALEVLRRPDAFSEAIAWLVSEGHCVVRIGDALDPIRHPGMIDLSGSSRSTRLLELFVLLRSRFVVCESLGLQHLSCLTNTPSLLLNASDPFSGYPVRDDSLFTIRTAIDLDTGQTLTTPDLLGERYFRNVRNCGFRDNTATEVLAAVREMHEGVTLGWRDSTSQTRFRERVTEAGASLAGRVPLVADWGPDRGFIGDGRLARWQADGVPSLQ